MKKFNLFDPDKKITYLLLLIMIIFPLIHPLGIAIKPSENTILAYNYVESLKPGSSVILFIDFGMGNSAELTPQVIASLKHFARKDLKVYAATQVPEMATALETYLEQTYGVMGKVYGEDYINLGYFAGAESAIGAMGDSLIAVFKKDIRGNDLTAIPMMKEVVKLPDINVVFAVTASGTIPFIRQCNAKFGMPIIFSVNAVMGPANVPYVQSGQAVSVLVGSTGAAQYETMIGAPGTATAAMDAQSLAHVVIILLILWGNIGYFVEKRQKKAKKSAEKKA
ncbi:MAG: hypothetical protein LLG09_06435 [Negativicutes bacterium]|nr:hypothetical protein [Negativicutes bacterium]